MTDTPAAISAHGWVSGPSPMAYQGVMLSMPVCHLGGFFGGFRLPIFFYCPIAITVRPTPTASFAPEGGRAGGVLGVGGVFSVPTALNVLTIPRRRRQTNT